MAACATSSGSSISPASGCFRRGVREDRAGRRLRAWPSGVFVSDGATMLTRMPVGRVGGGHRRHQGREGALGRGIGMGREQLRRGVRGGHAAHQQDRTARPRGIRGLLQHLPNDCGADEDLGPQVEGRRGLPGVTSDGVDRAVPEATAAAAGDREQAIDPTEPLDRCGHGGVHLGLLGQVGPRPRGTQALRQRRGRGRPCATR